VEGYVEGEVSGPLIKQIKFKPKAGTKIKMITAAIDDIAREMGVKNLRISQVCEGGCIGFEIANDTFQTTPLIKLLDTPEAQNAKGALPINLGVKIDGTPIFADLAKMPHLLVAGATGSGKSVGLNAFIISLIKRKKSSELKFVLIDPKRIEFSVYNNQKYMLMPVITDNADAADALQYLVDEMNKRYQLLEESLTKNIGEYNEKEGGMPYIVAIVDEFSDLVLSDKSVEKKIQILAQKARAAGIHLILSTQRPSVDVVTGSIKANFPSRLAFKTASGVDSKTILDTTGAEDLVGRGDALFLASTGELTRVHGAYVSTEEIDEVLKPYRAEVKAILPKRAEQEAASAPVERTKSKEKRGFFLFVWAKNLWNWLSKTEKKRFLKMIWTLLVGAFIGAKAKGKSADVFDSVADRLIKTKRSSTRRRTTSRR
ncbi:MAG: DUF87 domain-containing protein, partial [Alphaproteobacteria bacterium]|nr:DUF87 domain-containing protein [Alphaproteobacteria bacterium]